ncbi:MAG: LPS export ABC transporter periplasmic protein LptC [Rickettsiales bacterium]|nr:LPS export ABC transporter periplasmic protein LptC [Rickettsiales bacterium]
MKMAAEALERRKVGLTARRTQRASRVYGQFVGLMKVILPTVAMALLLVVVIWPQLKEQDGLFQIGFEGKIDRTAAENLRMERARYTGVDRSKRPFFVTAEAAEQADPNSPAIELLQPKADILMEDGSWVAITAELGNYNRLTQFLELAGTVNLFHDKGYEFRTTSAVFDLRSGDAIGTEPVEGQGSFGHLQAEGFTIRNHGESVELHGKSHVILLSNPTDLQKGMNKK